MRNFCNAMVLTDEYELAFQTRVHQCCRAWTNHLSMIDCDSRAKGGQAVW